MDLGLAGVGKANSPIGLLPGAIRENGDPGADDA